MMINKINEVATKKGLVSLPMANETNYRKIYII